MSRSTSRRLPLAAAVTVALTLAACGLGDREAETQRDRTVALLLAKPTATEPPDRAVFERRLKQDCPDCTFIFANAGQDTSLQQEQADAALEAGAAVMVLNAVDVTAAPLIVSRADEAGAAVIAYDRLITDADIDYYVSFDNEHVGRLQAQALVDRLTVDGTVDPRPIVMLNGSPTDNNAAQFKRGAHSVLDGKVTIGREHDVADWNPGNAHRLMEQAIDALGHNIAGVYAANDPFAGAVIEAMKAAGFDPIPPTTGQDAELAAVQRILVGEQAMTVYKPVSVEAEQAAALAAAIVQDNPRPEPHRTFDNGREDVPSFIFAPVAVTKENIEETVIADGFWTTEQICTGPYLAACASAGIGSTGR